MNFIKKNMWMIMSLALVVVLSAAGDAFAQGTVTNTTVMSTAMHKAVNAFQAIKNIIFVVGGFGLIVLAFFAIFGKIKWPWFAALAVGLAILAAAGSIVSYATGAGTGSLMGDTFGQIDNSTTF